MLKIKFLKVSKHLLKGHLPLNHLNDLIEILGNVQWDPKSTKLSIHIGIVSSLMQYQVTLTLH